MTTWFIFLFGIAIVFSILEWRGLHDSGATTFTGFMRWLAASFPFSLFLWGLLVGGLAGHFWWTG